MKLVFFGTSEFAVQILKILHKSSHEVLMVVTQPDGIKDRGHKLHRSPVKIIADQLGINHMEPLEVNDQETQEILRGINADIFIVVSYGSLLKNSLMKIAKRGAINVHPSLLPKYRGAAPIQRSIMSGDLWSGVTIMEMVEALDAGPILLQKKVRILNEWNTGDLSGALTDLGGKLLLEALQLLEEGRIQATPQDENEYTYAKKLTKAEKYVSFEQNAKDLHNRIRGLLPTITPLVKCNDRLLGLMESNIEEWEGSEIPGEILKIDKEKGILVKCKEGALWLTKVKPEGKKSMNHKDFLNGNKLKVGDQLHALNSELHY